MHLSIDHLIIRSGTPEATLEELADRAGLPVLAGIESVAGIRSGIVRAGPLDIEVVGIGGDPPREPHGYGVGLVADVGLDEAIAHVRGMGFPTSPAVLVRAGVGEEQRAWRAAQVRGLLPDPFPVAASTRPPGRLDRVTAAAAGAMAGIPAIARAVTRRAGHSMVVLTEYDFDVARWRASVDAGPAVAEVHLGTGGYRGPWERLRLNGSVRLHLDDEGPAGIRRIVLRGAGEHFALGGVAFEHTP